MVDLMEDFFSMYPARGDGGRTNLSSRSRDPAVWDKLPDAGPSLMKELFDASHACDSPWFSAAHGAVFSGSKAWKYALRFRNFGS
jgi:hypothetical protein